MQVLNTTESPITIAGVHTIPAMSLKSFDDELWAKLRERKAVVYWLGEGRLKEVGGGVLGMVAEGTIEARHLSVTSIAEITAAQAVEKGDLSGDELRTLEEMAQPRDPLDHDGDGRKGGSKPRNKVKR